MSPSSGKRRETPTLLGLLQRGKKRSSFQNVVSWLFRILEVGQSPHTQRYCVLYTIIRTLHILPVNSVIQYPNIHNFNANNKLSQKTYYFMKLLKNRVTTRMSTCHLIALIAAITALTLNLPHVGTISHCDTRL
jgi:hypothetical protein